MNAEIDKLLNEAADFGMGIHRLLRSPNLDDFRLALQELARALDLRICKIMELNAETGEAEPKPKLSPVP